MSTPTFTIESVHGIKQTFVLGPTVQVPQKGLTENQQPETNAGSMSTSQTDARGANAPQNPR